MDLIGDLLLKDGFSYLWVSFLPSVCSLADPVWRYVDDDVRHVFESCSWRSMEEEGTLLMSCQFVSSHEKFVGPHVARSVDLLVGAIQEETSMVAVVHSSNTSGTSTPFPDELEANSLPIESSSLFDWVGSETGCIIIMGSEMSGVSSCNPRWAHFSAASFPSTMYMEKVEVGRLNGVDELESSKSPHE
eukprot:scaffold1407_cov379-Pavlova_lutheri.AAC.6